MAVLTPNTYVLNGDSTSEAAGLDDMDAAIAYGGSVWLTSALPCRFPLFILFILFMILSFLYFSY